MKFSKFFLSIIAFSAVCTSSYAKNSKCIVIYESQTGFTAKYAQWIAQELGCECKYRKDIASDELKNYETVIYGGWIRANKIVSLSKTQKKIKPSVIFAVGSTPAYEEVIEEIKKSNKIYSSQQQGPKICTPFFYFEGGFDFEKLSSFQKKILLVMKKQVAKKENKTRQEIFMVENLGTSFDHSSKDQIIPLVDFVRATK